MKLETGVGLAVRRQFLVEEMGEISPELCCTFSSLDFILANHQFSSKMMTNPIAKNEKPIISPANHCSTFLSFQPTVSVKREGGGGGDKNARSRSSNAGMQFPVGPIGRLLKSRKVRAGRVSPGRARLLDCRRTRSSGNAARENKKAHTVPLRIQFVVRNDEELNSS